MLSQLEKVLLPTFLVISLAFPLTAQVGDIVGERETKVLQVGISAAYSSPSRRFHHALLKHAMRLVQSNQGGFDRLFCPVVETLNVFSRPMQAMTSMGLLHSAYWVSWHVFHALINLTYAFLFTVVGIIFKYQVMYQLPSSNMRDSHAPCPTSPPSGSQTLNRAGIF